MKRLITWFWLLNKRLLKKPSFVAILLLVPLVVASFAVASESKSGMLTVAVAAEEKCDIYAQILDRLEEGSGLISIVDAEAEAAREAVKSGSVDAAWVFSDDLEKRFADFADGKISEKSLVTVYQREESVLLQMAREKLLASMYPQLSYSLYSDFVRDKYPALDAEEEELRGYYDAVDAEGYDLFRIVYPEGGEIKTENGYLLSPMRGLLAVLTVIGGLAASMFYLRDEREMRFALVSENKRFVISLIYSLVAVMDIAVASLIALAATGLSVGIGRELLLCLMLALSTVGFCTLLRLIVPKEELIGALIPVVAVAMIALCPIFININVPSWLRMLIPAGGYLAGVYSNGEILCWSVYICATFIASFCVFKLKSLFLHRMKK